MSRNLLNEGIGKYKILLIPSFNKFELKPSPALGIAADTGNVAKAHAV